MSTISMGASPTFFNEWVVPASIHCTAPAFTSLVLAARSGDEISRRPAVTKHSHTTRSVRVHIGRFARRQNPTQRTHAIVLEFGTPSGRCARDLYRRHGRSTIRCRCCETSSRRRYGRGACALLAWRHRPPLPDADGTFRRAHPLAGLQLSRLPAAPKFHRADARARAILCRAATRRRIPARAGSAARVDVLAPVRSPPQTAPTPSCRTAQGSTGRAISATRCSIGPPRGPSRTLSEVCRLNSTIVLPRCRPAPHLRLTPNP